MVSYFAVPVRREGRELSYDANDDNFALGRTPRDAHEQLGLVTAGDMFAVWAIEGSVAESLGGDITKTTSIAKATPPLKIYVVVEEGIVFPLALSPIADLGWGI